MSAASEGEARPIAPWVPVREELRGEEPYGAPQLDVPVQLNTNENPYGPSEATARDIADAVFRAATELNRYPDREAADLRAALADYLGHGLTADNLWAANGSNDVAHPRYISRCASSAACFTAGSADLYASATFLATSGSG